MIRKPIVAGQFYSYDKRALEKEIKSFIKEKPDKNIRGIIAPHAGYAFSGKCAGQVYSLLTPAETYVIAGVNHHGAGKDIAISLEDFETPLGTAENDTALGKEILSSLGIKEDNEAHRLEHSIEVQLPFLQYLFRKFRIVPIILKNYNLDTCRNLASSIFHASEKLKRKIIVIASSDFTHSGPNYGFSADKNIDKKAINEILRFNSGKFLEISKNTTICGAGAICTLIDYCKSVGVKKARLVDYYTSQDIMPSKNWVGYAGIVFSK